MKDENTQVPDTFDEQEELRSEKKRAPAIFFRACLLPYSLWLYYRRNIFPEV